MYGFLAFLKPSAAHDCSGAVASNWPGLDHFFHHRMRHHFGTGAKSQWVREKFGVCRTECVKTFAITRGNGTKNVLVIKSQGVRLDLEDLASQRTDGYSTGTRTGSLWVAISALLWTTLLITKAGLKQNTWYFLLIGCLGTAQNIYTAVAPRRPEAFGIHLDYKETIVGAKVMTVLQETERLYPGVGASLISTFFPGQRMSQIEVGYWQGIGGEPESHYTDHSRYPGSQD